MRKIMSSFSKNDSSQTSESVSQRMPPALWRRLLLPLLAFAWSIALGPSSLLAQNIQHTENKPDLALRSDTRVDPSTLGMSFSIPLASYPGRAGNGLPVAITYSSKSLRLEFTGVDYTPVTGAKTWTTFKFAEHSTAGWTSTLSPPRVEFTGMGQFFDGQGRPACADPPRPTRSAAGAGTCPGSACSAAVRRRATAGMAGSAAAGRASGRGPARAVVRLGRAVAHAFRAEPAVAARPSLGRGRRDLEAFGGPAQGPAVLDHAAGQTQTAARSSTPASAPRLVRPTRSITRPACSGACARSQDSIARAASRSCAFDECVRLRV